MLGDKHQELIWSGHGLMSRWPADNGLTEPGPDIATGERDHGVGLGSEGLSCGWYRYG